MFYRFHDRWADKYYFSTRCRPCHQLHKKHNPNTPRQRKKEKLQLRYGLTYEQWEKMREEQNFSCMICGISEDEYGKKLDVDHCHNTGKVRGLLCNPCNTMIGLARDNLKLLESAVQYLKLNSGGYK